MLLINPKDNLKTIEFLTTLDPNFADQNLKVCNMIFFHSSLPIYYLIRSQICSSIYESMQSGDYGQIESSILKKYRLDCNRLWPQANLFQRKNSSSTS